MGDNIYRERAELVAHLSRLYPSVLSYADPSDPDWPVLYVHTPAGQLSWHIWPDDLDLFPTVPVVAPADARAHWDGHSTATKYDRLRTLPYNPDNEPAVAHLPLASVPALPFEDAA